MNHYIKLMANHGCWKMFAPPLRLTPLCKKGVHLYQVSPPLPKCVDKKDAQQKHRIKMRYFCVNTKKSRKYSSKSLKVKNQTPFFQNNETGDASKRKIARP